MHQRKIEDNKRLQKLYKKTRNSYGCGVYKNKDGRLIRYYKSNIKAYKFYKKYARKQRRNKLKKVDYDVSKNVFDLFWHVY